MDERSSSGGGADACWVCLESTSEASGPLERPCACPRSVHLKCLARWNLQQAGREEERFCRFCKSELPDWRSVLTPKVPAAPPVMAIVYDGKVVRLQVKPGREGMEEFQRAVRRAFSLGDDVELDCVFDCRAPGTGEKIKLRGLESYSAAMHCAAVAAGERLAKSTAASASASGSAPAPGAPETSPGPTLHPTSSAPLQGLHPSAGSERPAGQAQGQQGTPLQHGPAGGLPAMAAAEEGLVLPPASSTPLSSFSQSGSGLPTLGSTSSSSAITTAALVTGAAGVSSLRLELGEMCGGGGGVQLEEAAARASSGGSSARLGAMTPGRRRTFLGTLLKSLQGAKRVC